MMFFKFRPGRKKTQKTYDRETQIPLLRKSICTGEMTAGFRNTETGRFEEVMLIRSEADVDAFMEEYGLSTRPEVFY